MEWSSKVPPWDMAELEQGAELVSMGALVRPGFVLGSQSGGLMDCSVDLRLGRLGEFRPAERWLPDTAAPAAVAAAPSRRARASCNAGASCLVDECKSDLSNSREYHRRHKVCEVHSKTPVVMVGGQEQRFCQQCSRFHQLVEFDEVKRSCRKRLDGHNRRRRKPQPESINTSSLFPSTQGMLYMRCLVRLISETKAMQILKPKILRAGSSSRFLMYPPPHATPTPAQGHKGTVPLATSLHGINSQQSFSGCPSAGNMKPFPFPFSQSTFQPMIKATPSAESGSRILAQAFDSECALSLLSAAAAAATQDSGIGQMQLPAGRIPMHQPLVSELAYATAQASCYAPAPTTFSGPGGAEDGTVGDVFVCEAGAGLHCQCSQALPFSWQ